MTDSAGTDAVRALNALRKRMSAARTTRANLKRLLAESEYLLESHHSAFALENVTMDREIDRLRDEITETKRAVQSLLADAETAATEHGRLEGQNSDFLRSVSAKESTKNELKVRVAAIVAAERRLSKASLETNKKTTMLSDLRSGASLQRRLLMAAIGTNHAKNLGLEQSVLDMRLELDAHRQKLGLPSRKHEVAVDFAAYLGSCSQAECVRLRKMWEDLTRRPDLNVQLPPLQPL